MSFIAWKAKNFGEEVPDAGEYKAKVKSVVAHLSKKNMAVVSFELEDGYIVKGYYNIELTSYSLLAALINAVKGRVPDKFNLEELIDKEVLVTVTHRKVDQSTFPNITAIRPAEDDEEEPEDGSDDEEEDESASYTAKKQQKGMRKPKKRKVDDDDDDE